MKIEQLIAECKNTHIVSIITKLIGNGVKLDVYANNCKHVSGVYVVGFGGYTITRK